VLKYLELQHQWQVKLREQDLSREEARTAEIKAALAKDKAEREDMLIKTQADAVVATLSQQMNKEIALTLQVIANLADKKERNALVKATLDKMRAQEVDAAEIDEPNRVLRTALKKLKSLTGEEQDDMYERLKSNKRKAEGCGRCGRTNHTTKDCFAQTAVGGATKRGKTQGYAAFFPATAAPAAAAAAPAAAAAVAPAAQEIKCYACGAAGHKSF
jgi:hypothetical protein